MNDWIRLACLAATALIVARIARRKGEEAQTQRLQPINEALQVSLEGREEEVMGIRRTFAIVATRLE